MRLKTHIVRPATFLGKLMGGAALLALTGCGGDDPAPSGNTAAPAPSPSPSPTPSPTPSPSPTPTTVLTSDIQYGEGATASGNIPLFLDLYAPDAACTANRPTVLFVHGGGFVGGNKVNDNLEVIADEMVARGINVVSIQYRLDPEDPIPGTDFQAILDDFIANAGVDPTEPLLDAIGAAFEDTVLALNFLESNQDNLCVDTDALAYWGSSAGAFTVLQTGYGLNQFGIDRPDPRVVVDYWGGLFRDSDLEVGEAPFLVIHGTNDATVEFAQAQEITGRADVVAVSYAFYTVNGGGHGFGSTGTFTLEVDGQTLLERTADFVEAHLTGGTPIYGRFEVDR
ncbi:MAG: alpha/beta hydrolase fold domain-containing protein [Pseudomonadota bacterium]